MTDIRFQAGNSKSKKSIQNFKIFLNPRLKAFVVAAETISIQFVGFELMPRSNLK